MQKITRDMLIEKAEALLADGTVNRVLGWKNGEFSYDVTPALFESVEDMKKAVELAKGKAETECSGNVTKENVARLVDIGVDYISSGALTHSAPILDLSLKNLHAI